MENYTKNRTYQTKTTLDALKMLAILKRLEQWRAQNRSATPENIKRKVRVLDQIIR